MSDANENKDLNEIDKTSNSTEAQTDTVAVDESVQDQSNGKKHKVFKDIIEYVELATIFIVIVIVIFSFVGKVCRVEGDSMNKTLLNGENLFIVSAFYTPQRGDVVVIHEPEVLPEPFIKRVIAIEGDTVSVTHLPTSMEVVVTHPDGTTETLTEEYVNYDYEKYFPVNQNLSNYKIEEGKVFVMGDNRLNSHDSRAFGAIDKENILGKAVFRFFPFNKIGTVK